MNYLYYDSPYDDAYVPRYDHGYVPEYVNYYEPEYSDHSAYSGSPYYSSYPSAGYYESYPNSYPVAYSPTYGYAEYIDDGYDAGGIGGILNELPVGEIVSELAGNSFVGELLSGFLTQGYDQGYMAGQYARDSGYDDEESYYDPYALNNTYYDAYSVNLAENRRVFSEGYEAGYRDALTAEQDEYEPFTDSQPDLISLLAGNLLSGI